MTVKYQMYINGEWTDSSSGETFPTENPYNGETWALIPSGTKEDAERAIAGAKYAFDNEWSQVNGAKRSMLMHKLADLIDENATLVVQGRKHG